MTVSKLARATIATNKRNTRTQRISKFTPHYMCAKWTGEQCATYFRDSDRQASANYCIGYDGGIVCNVPEEYRAWTSSSTWNDQRAITVECANLPGGALTEATWDALVRLGADVCRRYGFRPRYDGTKDGTITEHLMFASTDCPGPWLHPRMGDLAKAIEAELDGTKPSEDTKAKPDEVVSMIHTGDVLRFCDPAGADHLITSDSAESKSLKGKSWHDEGSLGKTAANGVLVYRLYNPDSGDHLWTASYSEARKLVEGDWMFEGDSFLAYAPNTEGHPVYRLYNLKQDRHLFTRDGNEVKALVTQGWSPEGVAFNLGD